MNNKELQKVKICNASKAVNLLNTQESLLTAVIKHQRQDLLHDLHTLELFVTYLQFLKKHHISNLILLMLCLFSLPELFLGRISVHGINLKEAI